MCLALTELKRKGCEITDEEETAAKIAILLHDAGHGPYSHALEGTLLQGIHHEAISLKIMHRLNEEMNGQLQMAINIFTDNYPKKYLHQLTSGQLDVDRMDYLTRDSYFTGVSEGVIGYDRIISMLTVHNGQLMVEEKGIYSIEKFLVARRLMYWQVYLHKTVLVSEQMLVRTIRRAKEISAGASGSLAYFLQQKHIDLDLPAWLQQFSKLDDVDVMMAIKQWQHHPDIVLATLCNGLLNRQLFKIKFYNEVVKTGLLEEKKKEIKEKFSLDDESVNYFVFTGDVNNTTYDSTDERINILFKDNTVKDISEVDNALILKSLAATARKFYICEIR